MAQTLDITAAGRGGMRGHEAPFGLFKNLERPGDVFRDLGPNWFAAVMGTGIVANASAVLPPQMPGLLIPHIAPGQGRQTLLLACYAMFGISLFASVIITQVWSRLVTHKPGAAVMVPTLWIVLGPLGQSITAAGNLGTQAAHVLPAPYAAGVAVFALTWWSFTFPVGTCVTGTISLAARCHADVLRGASVLLFALLPGAWLVVAARTVSGAASGRLFAPASAGAAISRALST
jgi:tellurite resistance protein TehA-like permease